MEGALRLKSNNNKAMKNRLPVTILALGLLFANTVSYAQEHDRVNIYDDIFRSDSLLTQEQIDIKVKLTELIPGAVKVEQGVVVTSLKKRDFKKREIPVYYYKMLLRDIKDINDWIKSGKITPEEFEKQLKTMMFERPKSQ